MEIHQLRYAVAVGDILNFRRAAERCHVTQPSLSVQVRKLEEELGGRLFDRLGRSVRITPVGERFLPEAKSILLRLESAKAAVRDELEDPAGIVRVAVIPTVAPFWLPMVLPGFRKRWPTVEVIVCENTTEVLLARLRDGEIDYGVASLPLDEPRLTTTPLLKEQLLLALPRGHPLDTPGQVRLSDTLGWPWILLMDEHCLRQQVVGLCSQRGRRVDTVLETSQVASLLGLVAAGLGITLVPEMAATPRRDVAYRQVHRPKAKRDVVLVSHADHFLVPAARRFARWCVDQASRSSSQRKSR